VGGRVFTLKQMPLHDEASVKYFAENLVASHCDVPCLFM
jgi:hypothetical protein